MAGGTKRIQRENMKAKCLQYLGGKICKKCSNNWLPQCCYDFHHKIGNKENCISVMLNELKPFSKIQKELDKCVVLCRNCHTEVHYYNIKL